MVELKKNIVLIGGGGHCSSVIDIIENGNEFNILGILDSNIIENNLFNKVEIVLYKRNIIQFISENNMIKFTNLFIKVFFAR